MTLTATIAATPIAVSVTDEIVNVSLNPTVVEVALALVGPQGPKGDPGAGIDWGSDDITANVQMQPGRGYLMNNASRLTATLPLNPKRGDTLCIAGKGAGGWRIAQNPGQSIHFNSNSTTIGTDGYLQSIDLFACLTLLCITDTTDFLVFSSNGQISGN